MKGMKYPDAALSTANTALGADRRKTLTAGALKGD